MKRYALIALTFSFALAHLASAADDAKKNQKQAGRNAVVAKRQAARVAAKPGRQIARQSQARPLQRNLAARRAQTQVQARNSNRVNRTPRAANKTRMKAPAVVAQNNTAVNRNRTTVNRNNTTVNRNVSRDRDGRNWQGRNNNNNVSRNRDGRNWRDRNDNNDNNVNRNGRNWTGRHRNWDRNRHDRNWWRSRYTRFALFGGGYYYWNSGYWYPAYGYDPYFTTYTYDAPIYAYNNLDPGQVIASVQTELQRRGYNPGGVDGTYGPRTRQALLNYQGDNGLPITGEIDEDTLNSLGLQ